MTSPVTVLFLALFAFYPVWHHFFLFFGEYQETAANESVKIKTADRFGLPKTHRDNDP